jgi:hypothetical protein
MREQCCDMRLGLIDHGGENIKHQRGASTLKFILFFRFHIQIEDILQSLEWDTSNKSREERIKSLSTRISIVATYGVRWFP